MELYTVNIKRYKAIYFQTLIANILFIAAAYFLVKKGIHLVTGHMVSSPLLSMMVVAAVIYTVYANKKVDKLANIADFENRVKAHEQTYKRRMLWHLFACLIDCGLLLLTGRNLFLYFALFEIVMLLPLYPNLSLFKSQLKNDDIVFTEV